MTRMRKEYEVDEERLPDFATRPTRGYSPSGAERCVADLVAPEMEHLGSRVERGHWPVLRGLGSLQNQRTTLFAPTVAAPLGGRYSHRGIRTGETAAARGFAGIVEQLTAMED